MFYKLYYKENTKGFTLIELLVVIAIIGILATIVLASLNTARQRSRDAKRVGDLRNIQAALELYFDDNGFYPDGSGVTAVSFATDMGILVSDGLLPGTPQDPLDNTIYFYQYDANDTVAGNDATRYVMAVGLENPKHVGLKSDIDATVGWTTALDCADDTAGKPPYFCISN